MHVRPKIICILSNYIVEPATTLIPVPSAVALLPDACRQRGFRGVHSNAVVADQCEHNREYGPAVPVDRGRLRSRVRPKVSNVNTINTSQSCALIRLSVCAPHKRLLLVQECHIHFGAKSLAYDCSHRHVGLECAEQ